MLLGAPEQGVAEHLDEVGLVEEFGRVAEEEIDVLGLFSLIYPHYGVVAHLDWGVGLIGALKSSSNVGLMVNLSSQIAKSVHISQIPRKIQRGK